MSALLVLRFSLSVCLLLAFFGKAFAGPVNFRKALLQYGFFPGWFLMPISWIIIASEGLAGVSLLTSAYTIGATIAAFLGLLFLVSVGWSIVKGRNFHCQCFGTIGGFPIGWRLLLLNFMLFTGGVLLLIKSSTLQPLIVWTAWIVSFFIIILTIQIIQPTFRPLKKEHVHIGLLPGTVAPSCVVKNLRDQIINLSDIFQSKCILLFLSPNCPMCLELLKEINSVYPLNPYLRLVIIFSGNKSVINDLVIRYTIDRNFIVCDDVKPLLRKAYRIPGSPAVVMITKGLVYRTVLPVDISLLMKLISTINHTNNLTKRSTDS